MGKKSKCECIYVFLKLKKTFCIPATYINLYIKVTTMRNKVVLNLKKVGRRHSLWLSVLVPACLLSHIRLFAIPCTVAHQAPLSIQFSRQEHWSGLQCPPPGDLPDPGIEPRSPALQVAEPPGKPPKMLLKSKHSLHLWW